MELCERFHCLPSQLEKEDATLLRLMAIAERGGLFDQDDYQEGDELDGFS